jgi:hypothetical protein
VVSLAIYGKFSTDTLLQGMKNVLILKLLFAIIVCFWAQAQAQAISTSVDRSTGTLDDSFIFEVKVEDSTSEPPSLVGGDDFDISYLGINRMTQSINGLVSYRTIFRYELRPKHEGILETPSVEKRGQLTPPKRIQVAKAAPSSTRDPNAPLSLESRVSSTEPYVGEQVVSEILIHSNTPNPAIQKVDDLSTQGVWQQQMPPQSSKCTGRNRCTTTIAYALFPLKAGNLTIPGRSMVGAVPMQQANNPLLDPGFDPFGSSFQDFFAPRMRKVTLKSNEIELTVKPLPGKSVPLVGFVETIVTASELSLQVGKGTAQFGVKIVSDGNLESLKALITRPSTHHEIFWEEPQQRTFVQDGKLITEITFQGSVVATDGGDDTILFDPLEYFDPLSQTYKVATIDPIVLHISGDQRITPTVVATAPPQLALDPQKPASVGRTYLLLLGLGAVAFLSILVAVILYSLKRIRRRKYGEAIEKLSSPAAVKQALPTVVQLLTGKYPPLQVPLRQHIESLPPHEDHTVLLRVIDRLEECFYGGQTESALLLEIRADLVQLLNR